MTPAQTAATRLAELEADNARLRRLLEQRNAPHELRHRLRSTVALLLGVIRKSSGTKRDTEMYVGHLEDRIAAIVRAQSAADQHGAVDLHALLADELGYYTASEGDQLQLSGPGVALQPRAGQIFALAVHELAVNAVEHGSFGVDAGSIEVDWRVTDLPDKFLLFVWKERDPQAPVAPSSAGFGTEVLTRMLRYELGADTEIVFEPDGLRCTIRVPWNDRIAARPAHSATISGYERQDFSNLQRN